MKTLSLCFALVFACVSAFAANPTFGSFDTNDFTATASINFITANTSPLNPNALVNQSQLAASTGATNGTPPGTVTNIVAALAILRRDGYGTNTALENPAIIYNSSPDGQIRIWATNPPPNNGSISIRSGTNALIAMDDFGDLSIFEDIFNLNNGKIILNAGGGVVVIGGITGNGAGLTNLIHSSTVSSGLGTSVTRTKNTDGSTNYQVSATGTSNFVSTVSGGANITVTPAAIAAGGTNFGVGLNDPISLGQANVGLAWITNAVYPTNTLGGTVLDFAISDATSNIVGAVTFSSVANLTAGAVNRCVRTLINKTGSDQTLSITSGWNQGVYDTYVMTNNTFTVVFGKVQPGVYTNVYVKLTKPH